MREPKRNTQHVTRLPKYLPAAFHGHYLISVNALSLSLSLFADSGHVFHTYHISVSGTEQHFMRGRKNHNYHPPPTPKKLSTTLGRFNGCLNKERESLSLSLFRVWPRRVQKITPGGKSHGKSQSPRGTQHTTTTKNTKRQRGKKMVQQRPKKKTLKRI